MTPLPPETPKTLLIIGAGPGGEAAAKRAAARGLKVTLVEKNLPGGLCLNRGCIPSKTLLEAGRLIHAVRAASHHMTAADVFNVRLKELQKKKRDLVESLRNALSQRFKQLGVRVIAGEAKFLDAGRAEVTGPAGAEIVAFDAAVVAAGSRPFFPPPFDQLRDQVLDSDKILETEDIPDRLVVVGGGAIGCEFACLFQELGSRVTMIEKTEGLLPGEDPAVARTLQQSFEKRGIKVVTDSTVEKAARESAEWVLRLSSGDEIRADHILVCVGRRPAADGLGLETAGVTADGGRIGVNEFLQTSAPRIYAVGDVNGLSLLAHAAAAQGEIAVDHLLGGSRAYDNLAVPRCLYTWPEVASVGQWAHTAQARGVEIKTQRYFFQGSAKALASNEGEGFLQSVSAKADGRLLGAQIIGPHATELIHIFATALAGRMTVEQMKGVIFAHPTLSEGIREALAR